MIGYFPVYLSNILDNSKIINHFTNESIPLTILNFIQLSVKFWVKVISPYQNRESKYPMKILSDDAESFANILYQSQI